MLWWLFPAYNDPILRINAPSVAILDKLEHFQFHGISNVPKFMIFPPRKTCKIYYRKLCSFGYSDIIGDEGCSSLSKAHVDLEIYNLGYELDDLLFNRNDNNGQLFFGFPGTTLLHSSPTEFLALVNL